MRNYQGRDKRYAAEPKARLITLTETLIILHIAKTEFNNCFIIHLFLLNRYRLHYITGSDNSVICYQITEFSVGCVIARFNCKLSANQIAFTNYNV
jgi:hypothetical protein